MVFESKNPGRSFTASFNAGETIAEQRARIAHEQVEREERRQADLDGPGVVEAGIGPEIDVQSLGQWLQALGAQLLD